MSAARKVPIRGARPQTSDGRSARVEARGVAEELQRDRAASAAAPSVALGQTMLFAVGVTPREGWRRCAGGTVRRDELPELYEAAPGIFGPGDGSTTRTLPDLTASEPAGFSYWIWAGR